LGKISEKWVEKACKWVMMGSIVRAVEQPKV